MAQEYTCPTCGSKCEIGVKPGQTRYFIPHQKINIKILAQNIVNNPQDFTAKQIEQCFEELLQPFNENIITAPEWLTNETRELVKTTWNSHKDSNDNKRVEAIKIIQQRALDAGYKINIKTATDLLHKYCL